MAQHDQTIADQAGLSFLADLNAALAALFSNNSGATAPSVTTAYMWWADATTGWMKQRNAANDGWINRFKLADETSTIGDALRVAASAAAARTALGVSGQLQEAIRFTAGGTANAMTGTLAPAVTEHGAGLRVTTTPPGANTVTNPTLDIGGGAKTIKKRDSSGTKVALAAGDYNASGPFDFESDGTDFILLNPTPKEFSGSVKFPAAQVASSDPNTLDDYEEGTWTPGDISGGGLSFSSVAATYEKIGRLVIARFAFTFPATADTNSVTVSGLPFATANNNSARQGFVSYCSESTAARLLVGANSTVFQVTNSTGAPLTNATMSTDTIFGAVIYYV